MREATAFGSKTPHLGLLSAGVLIMIILLFTRFFPNRNQTSVQAGDGAEFAAHYLCRFSGIEITIESVRKLISSKDRSLNHLVSALKQLEVRTEIRRLSIDDIDSDSLPAAIEMQNPKHFIVVTGRNDQTFFLFGPDGARRSTQVENLREHWTGNCLTLTNCERVKKVRVGARADFETLIIDKGFVSSASGSLEYEFPFVNDGDIPFEYSVSSNCSCKVVDSQQRTILPGERSSVRVKYSVNPLKPHFVESVLVQTNSDVQPRIELTIAGSVPGGARLSVTQLDFGVSRDNNPLLRTVTMTHARQFAIDGFGWNVSKPWLRIVPVDEDSPSTIASNQSAFTKYSFQVETTGLDKGANSATAEFCNSAGVVLFEFPVNCFRL